MSSLFYAGLMEMSRSTRAITRCQRISDALRENLDAEGLGEIAGSFMCDGGRQASSLKGNH